MGCLSSCRSSKHPTTVDASVRQLAQARSVFCENFLAAFAFTPWLCLGSSAILRWLGGAPFSPSAPVYTALRGRASVFYLSPAHLRVLSPHKAPCPSATAAGALDFVPPTGSERPEPQAVLARRSAQRGSPYQLPLDVASPPPKALRGLVRFASGPVPFDLWRLPQRLASKLAQRKGRPLATPFRRRMLWRLSVAKVA